MAFHPLEDMETAVEVLDEIGSDKMQIIFDPANLLQDPESVRQKAFWERCLSLGENRIAALHLKDFHYDKDGNRQGCALGEGIMELSPFWKWIRGKEDMPVIRDELDLTFAEKDMIYLKKMKSQG